MWSSTSESSVSTHYSKSVPFRQQGTLQYKWISWVESGTFCCEISFNVLQDSMNYKVFFINSWMIVLADHSKSIYRISIYLSQNLMPLQNYRGSQSSTCYQEVTDLFENIAVWGVKHWSLRLHTGLYTEGVKLNPCELLFLAWWYLCTWILWISTEVSGEGYCLISIV